MKKPRPIKAIGSKRRAAGWMLLTLGLLVAAAWVASGWWTYFWSSSTYEQHLSIRHGFVVFETESRASNRYEGLNGPQKSAWVWWHGWSTAESNAPGLISTSGFRGVFAWHSISGSFHSTAVYVILWPLPLLLWTTGGLALWSGRRARRRALEGHCPTCGYNLAGLNRDAGVGVCPECGKAKAV